MIAETANSRLAAQERGALVRQIAARPHAHSDGSQRTYSRVTIDRWLRAWRARGLDALKPAGRSDTGIVRAHPELFAEAAALRLELPGRSAPRLPHPLPPLPAARLRGRRAAVQLPPASWSASRHWTGSCAWAPSPPWTSGSPPGSPSSR